MYRRPQLGAFGVCGLNLSKETIRTHQNLIRKIHTVASAIFNHSVTKDSSPGSLKPMRWCSTPLISSSVTLFVITFNPRYTCIASALMISPLQASAMSMATRDFPEPVVPITATNGPLVVMDVSFLCNARGRWTARRIFNLSPLPRWDSQTRYTTLNHWTLFTHSSSSHLARSRLTFLVIWLTTVTYDHRLHSQGFENLVSRIKRLSKLNPLGVSITWGAGGSTREWSLKLAGICRNEHNISGTIMHLTCTNMQAGLVDDALRVLWICFHESNAVTETQNSTCRLPKSRVSRTY